MTIILIRTLIVYAVLIMIMRFMGKRQLGELEISDLVTTFLISEIASLPMTDTEIPLSHAVLPILGLTSLEVLLSGALLKLPLLNRIFSVRPAILIRHGVPAVCRLRRLIFPSVMTRCIMPPSVVLIPACAAVGGWAFAFRITLI